MAFIIRLGSCLTRLPKPPLVQTIEDSPKSAPLTHGGVLNIDFSIETIQKDRKTVSMGTISRTMAVPGKGKPQVVNWKLCVSQKISEGSRKN